MDQDTLSKFLQNRAKELPAPLFNAIKNGDVVRVADALSDIYNLNQNQTGLLKIRLFMLFLGLYPISQLKDTLFLELKLSESVLLDVLDDLAKHLLNGEILVQLLSIENALNKPNISDLSEEIASTEATLSTMPSLRNVNPVTPDAVYTSTQSAILQDSLHNPNNNATPR